MSFSLSPSREPPMFADPSSPTAYGGAATALLDIVVFAGGDSLDLMPLSGFEQKCMLRICNRPMIWYCLAPWVEAGFRSFFLVVNEDYATLRTYLSREFVGVEFYFVFVPLMAGEHASTTCDGVKAYLRFKEQLREGTADGSMAVGQGATGGASPSGSRATTTTTTTGTGAGGGGIASPTAASPRHLPLRVERAALASFRRDALLLSCDTILAGVDVERFVSNFYSSMASVSAMFFRPHVPEKAAASDGGGEGGKGKRKGGGGGGCGAQPERKSFTYSYTCAAYEEDDTIDAMSSGGSSHSQRYTTTSGGGGVAASSDGNSGNSSASCDVQHRRLHYMYPFDERPELRVTMAFAARRPNLTFAADLVDAHAYIVRSWVLDFIAESAGIPDASVRKYIMPLLARSQHTLVNTADGAFIPPDKKIEHTIPTHWMYRRTRGEVNISVMNAAQGPLLPEKADNLRAFCTIFAENPAAPMKIYRINTRDNYQAVNQEIIHMKCQLLGLLEDPVAAAAAASLSIGGARHGGGVSSRPAATSRSMPAPLLRAPSNEPLLYSSGFNNSGPCPPNPNASASALSLLLPDNPFTLRHKLGSQQVYILGSFISSVPPPNAFITRSVIGPNVTIAAGARITDSVILANVDIGAKAVITGSVIGTSAFINADMRVTNTIVAPRCVVEEDAEDTIVE